MDARAIGVFDSGLGGLTAVRQLQDQLPGEKIIYFGDTSRVPYGTRTRDTIVKYVRQDIHFLLAQDIKAIVIACNTADTTARKQVMGEYDLPIFGVVEPAAKKAARVTRNGKIGLIGTQATIRSGVYGEIIAAENPAAQLMQTACPLLVPLVENGRFRPGDRVAELVIAEYLQPLKDWGCDTLVLGCTHYPLLWDIIGDYMGPDVRLINSGREAAKAVAEGLRQADLLAAPGQTGGCRYFVSDAPDGFSQLASLFLERDVTAQVEQIDIETY
jgi:glutamate racemase